MCYSLTNAMFAKSAVYDLLVDELEANPTVLNIRGETVGRWIKNRLGTFAGGILPCLLAPSILQRPIFLARGPSLSQPLELAARMNRKEMFYHILFKNREIMWQYGSRVNYNLDLRVVDGAPPSLSSTRALVYCRRELRASRVPFLRRLLLVSWSIGLKKNFAWSRQT